MLVLSRKPTESVVIGSDVRITVLKIDRNQVRIGIEAPQSVPVLRAELVFDGDDLDAADRRPAHALGG